MANNTVTIYCAKPLPAAAEPQPVKKEPAIADGVCRPTGNLNPVDLKGGVLEIINSDIPTVNGAQTNPIQAALATPDADAGGVRPRSGPRRDTGPAADVPTANAAADPVAGQHRAEPAMSVTTGPQVDVVVDETGKIIPKDKVTPKEQRALEQAARLPTSSGDAILAANKDGLVTGMQAVLDANPDLVANAVEQGVNATELRIILANALWPHAVSSGGDRFAVPLRTYPGAYLAIFQEHMAAKARGDIEAANKALDANVGVAQTGIDAYRARGDSPELARRNFFNGVVNGANAERAFYDIPANRAALADPSGADRVRSWAQMSPAEKRTVANTIDRGYRAAGYDPSDEEPLYYDESDTSLSMADGEAGAGVYAEVHQAIRENARRQERQATANRERIRSVNLQNDRDHGVRIARRRDMDIFAYRGRVVPGTMTAALRDPFRRTL